MNANRLRAVIVWSSLPLASVVFVASAAAAPKSQSPQAPPATGQSAGRENLSRENVGKILKQAQAAIKQGNFDQADALVKRAEAAGVHYHVFHFGATPASVRKELALARSNRRPTAKPADAAAANRAKPHSQPDGYKDKVAANGDPFVGREPVLPKAPSTQPIPPSMPGGEHADPNVIEATATRDLPTMGESVANPFAPSPGAGPQAARYEANPNAGYAAQQADYSEVPALVSNANAATPEAPLLGNPADGANWTLPDAPLPPGNAVNRTATASRDNLAMPRQPESVAETTGDSPRTAQLDAKQQALENLATARQALQTGDLDLAEQLARQVSALGVPESQFLPNEDRPSLLAWDVLRARQNQPSSPAAIPAESVRRADRLDESPAANNGPRLAAAEPMDSNDRWAMLPDPLMLPPESTPPAGAPVETSPPTTANDTAGTSASALLRAGEAALVKHDRDKARELLNQAYDARDQLPDGDKQRLQERLQMLSAEAAAARTDSQRIAANIPLAAGQLTPAEPLPPIQAEPLPPAVSAPVETPLPSAEPLEPPTNEPPVSVSDAEPAQTSPPVNSNLLESAGVSEQSLARLFSAEIGKRQADAKRLQAEDPERAVAVLRKAQDLVKKSKLSEDSRRELLNRLQITLDKSEKYVADHKVEIEIDRQNKSVKDQVERDRETKLKVQQKIADMVEEFNRLRDEQRYAEMEIVARRLHELAPDEQVVQQVISMSKFIRRNMMNAELMDKKEESFWAQLDSTERSAVNPVAADGHEVDIDQKHWDAFVKNRKGSKDRVGRRTERELEIERRLKTPIMVHYQETPLSTVMENLQQLAGVNIHLDPRGLSQEGVNSDTPVTVNLNKEISLKSALNLILEPLHLSYVIKDEVLKITSEQLRDGEVYPDIYNVADLVIPIPNFVPNSNIGLQGLIHDAYGAMGYGGGIGMPGPTVLVNQSRAEKASTAAGNDNVLAQQMAGSPTGSLGGQTVPIGAGPGGMGGGANADFDSLIDLIVSTVHTETWAENGGGEAEIRPFPTNLSLVISQTQAVHEEIADLLAQLRRLQDLQVTIEVRFIRLNDSFFERIGVDFDMDVVSNTIPATAGTNGQFTNSFVPTQTATVGMQRDVPPNNPFPNFTSDLDIPFRQNSFLETSLTPFGNAAQIGSFGFAILSDIEAYFLVEAAQGDRRTNVLNAPKVTLFNGQQAFVSDATSRPFVIGVIPVVGEFAAAQQPVIVVLNEGTMMTIQAVVSDDRRYVRLTVVPFFTQVGDVQEFTFEGSSSSTNSSSTTDDDNNGKNESKDESSTNARSGVTVQLPSFSFVSVVTTVSVPDGGTVLLGGIKRLSEGRNEFGVPLLSKVPYINRLFRNVAIGRETDSLMMMVTPRIIIQEEEEERLGIATPTGP